MNLARLYHFILHLASWLAFFILVLSISPKPGFHFRLPHPPFPPFFIILFPLLASFYYLNQWIFIPKILAWKMRIQYVGAIVVFLIITISVPILEPIWITWISDHKGSAPPHIISINVLISTLLFLIILIASSGEKIVKYWFSAENLKKEMEFEKTITELSFLKSQINPHFLFNTLNNIYTLSILKSDKAPEAVLKLADMMRYVLSDIGDREVPIQQELEYIEKFISLQKIRLTDKVVVNYEVFGIPENQKVAPLLLLPFIENAFKFGVSTRENSILGIIIQVKQKSVTLQVENQTFEEKIAKNLSTGTGLKNVKRRLELLYPKNHWLRIEQIGNKFYIDLNINL